MYYNLITKLFILSLFTIRTGITNGRVINVSGKKDTVKHPYILSYELLFLSFIIPILLRAGNDLWNLL
jgi:hypothetical protein